MYGVICMSKYIHGRTCVYNINYHIVWCVKYRRKVLTPQISDKLYELVQSIAEEKGFPEIRKSLWNGHLWNGSYFCETIGSTSEENILKYIERQKNCQL